jgi:aminoglycoside phosphotransferase family enzyme/predicted kinase
VPGLDVLLRDLADPAAYAEAEWAGVPQGQRRVEVVQTHISAVFLTAVSAFKVKKPLRLWGLVDYGTPQARLHWWEEVRLNRRLAPDVYRGVVPIVERDGRLHVGGAGKAVEHAVAMRRFRPEDTLEARVQAGTATASDLAQLGTLLAQFHAKHRLGPDERARVRAATFAGVLAQNVRATKAFVPRLFPASVHEDLERTLARRLRRDRSLLRRRLARGLAVDGHGDVRLEHVLKEGSRLSVIDCVEFTTVWRHIDPLADAAFLVMDLLAHGAHALEHAFTQAYLAAAGDADVAALELFVAYRAHVRAKVDATTSAEAEVPAEQRARKAAGARNHLALAWTVARAGLAKPPLVVLRGPSGSGKSVLATALCPWLDALVVRSDEVRKAMFRLGPLDRPTPAQQAEVYGPAASEATYRKVLDEGLAAVRRGRAAILDATYLLARSRAAVVEACTRERVTCVVVDVVVEPQVARARLAARAGRNDDASDADVAVYEEQVRTAEPLTTAEVERAVRHIAGADPAATLMTVLDRVVAQEKGG